ncbi:hypothetical protein BDZ45DRAFT_747737 [Acephala macrosclerotiorum]|nr:hypothetical protein BDZ45DRAFT_747737 [Acephala macrosclerotiorum]
MDLSNSFSALLKLSDISTGPTKSKKSRKPRKSPGSRSTSSTISAISEPSFLIFADDSDTSTEPPNTQKSLSAAITEPSFHGFPNLPDEIKLQIWEHTIKPRCIKLASTKDCYLINSEPENHYPSTPSVLHASKLSRKEFLPRYQIMFKGLCRTTSAYRDGRMVGKEHGFWFDVVRDVLTLHSDIRQSDPFARFFSSASSEDVASIQCLALKKSSWICSCIVNYGLDSEDRKEEEKEYLARLRALKTIMIVGKDCSYLNQFSAVRLNSETTINSDQCLAKILQTSAFEGRDIQIRDVWAESPASLSDSQERMWRWSRGLEECIVEERRYIDLEAKGAIS